MKKLLSLVLLGALLLASPVWAQNAMYDRDSDIVQLQTAAAATGNGLTFGVIGYNTVGVELTISASATVTWEGSSLGTFYAIPCTNKTTGTSANTATASGSYVCDVAGLSSFRARISTFGSGTVTANARATTAVISAGSSGGTANGLLDATFTGRFPAAAAESDAIANPTLTKISTFMHGYNGTTWDRIYSDGTGKMQVSLYATNGGGTPGAGTLQVFGSSDALNPTNGGLFTFSGLMAYNGATFDRLQVDASKYLKVNCATGCAGGATTPTDAFANPTTAGLQMGFNMGWNGATWDRLLVDGSKFLKVNCATGCAGGASTPADAFANPTTAGLSMGFNMGWNGTTWDRLQVDASKFLKVNIAAQTLGKVLVTPDSVALPAHQSTNVDQLNGTTTDTNSGSKSAGTLRVVLATDQPALTNKLLVTPDSVALPANQSVNVSQINGVTPLMGNGTTGTGSPRVTIASDNTAFAINSAPATSGGASVCYVTSAASTNATNCKNAAGQIYGFDLINTTATTYYLRLYNLSAAPTCSSATGYIRTIPILSVGGVIRDISVGEAYGTGIGFCLTGGGSSTDNTNAATGVYLTIHYK